MLLVEKKKEKKKKILNVLLLYNFVCVRVCADQLKGGYTVLPLAELSNEQQYPNKKSTFYFSKTGQNGLCIFHNIWCIIHF